MMTAEWLAMLGEGVVVTTLAILLVLLLRRPLGRAFGAACLPLLWILVPMAQLAVLMPAPAREQVVEWTLVPVIGAPLAVADVVEVATSRIDWGLGMFYLWLIGVVIAAVWFGLAQRRFWRRLGRLRPDQPGVFLAEGCDAGPAVLGLLRPRIVLPADFRERYGDDQQALILAHERSHLRRGDVQANALATALRCLYWFNPLIHYAASRLRHDHELASDADVARRFPHSRRRYAATLLDVQLAVPGLPVGCLWQSSHPLKERILMLNQVHVSRYRRYAGLSLVIALALGGSLVAWAAQPGAAAGIAATQTSAAPASASMFHVRMKVDVDGEQSTPELLVQAGKDFAIGVGGWSGEFAYDAETEKLVRADLKIGDAPVGPVDLAALSAGKVVTVRAPDGRSQIALEIRISAAPDKDVSYGSLSPPMYPVSAIKAEQAGRVLLKVKIDTQGWPVEFDVLSSEPAGVFDAAALAAVEGWRFVPAIRDGKLAESWVQVPVCFSLDQTASDPVCDTPQNALDTIHRVATPAEKQG